MSSNASMRTPRRLFVGLGIMVLVSSVSSLSPVSTFVNWTQVSTSIPSTRNLNSASLGTCICDLTASGCDPNCCCDSDCLSAEVALFSECLEETVSGPEIDFCYNPNSGTELVRINSYGGTLDRVDVGRDAVCLIHNNYPSGSEAFFSVPDVVANPSAVLFSPDWYSSDTSTAGFTIGTRVPLVRFRNTSGTPSLFLAGSGFLTVPHGGPSGLCAASYEKPVEFFTPVTTSGCRVVGTTADACKYISLSRFTEQEAFANPGSTITEATTLIAITTKVFRASDGQLLYTIDNLPLRSSFFTLSNAASPTENITDTPLSTTWDSASQMCLNGVTLVRTIAWYDVTQAVRVRNVTREVYVGDVSTASSSGGSTFQQEVYFLRQDTMPVPREGNPGFVTGKYMPAGVLLTIDTPDGTKKAVQERVGGFAVPTGGKSCFSNRYRSVSFLHNVLSSGCTVDITAAELQTMCSSGAGTSALLQQILTLPATPFGDASSVNTTTSIITHIAKTADALNIDPSSWTAIVGIPLVHPAPSPYNAVTRSCGNLVVGLTYTFVVARAGKESNPQDVIVGAFVDPILGTWRIKDEEDYSSTATATVPFKFRVVFERYDAGSQTTVSRRIVAPPILPEIDDTVFYPFRMP